MSEQGELNEENAGKQDSWIEEELTEGDTCLGCKRGPLVFHGEEVDGVWQGFLYCPKCGDDYRGFASVK